MACRRCGTSFLVPSERSRNFDVRSGDDLNPEPEVPAEDDEIPSSASPDAQTTSETRSKSRLRRWNLIARNWRGELPLAVSFWVFVVLFNAAFYFTSDAIIDVLPPPTSPLSVFAWVVTAWMIIIIILIWQFVGVFRTARRRRRERREAGRGAFWAVTAMVWVGLGVIADIRSVALESSDQLRIIIDVAFRGDPDIPDFRVQIDTTASTITVSGGIKYGLAEALENALRDAPGTRTLVLNSPGGRLGAAELVFDVVRSHSLATHVDGSCASACTIIFAAGVERTIGSSGRLGYHSASSGYRLRSDDASADAYFRGVMIEAGFDASFTERVLRVSSRDIWNPTTAELFAAGAITPATAKDANSKPVN